MAFRVFLIFNIICFEDVRPTGKIGKVTFVQQKHQQMIDLPGIVLWKRSHLEVYWLSFPKSLQYLIFLSAEGCSGSLHRSFDTSGSSLLPQGAGIFALYFMIPKGYISEKRLFQPIYYFADQKSLLQNCYSHHICKSISIHSVQYKHMPSRCFYFQQRSNSKVYVLLIVW